MLDRFEPYLVANHEDRVSNDEAHISINTSIVCGWCLQLECNTLLVLAVAGASNQNVIPY